MIAKFQPAGPKGPAAALYVPPAKPEAPADPFPQMRPDHPCRALLAHLAPTPGAPHLWSGVAVLEPDLAARLIEATTLPNRRTIQSNLDGIKKQVAGGDWELNGDTIKFDAAGENTDGRHRLRACAETGTPLASFFVVGLPTRTRLTNDTGKSKRMGDFLGMAGHDNASQLAATAKLVFLWEQGRLERGMHSARQELFNTVEQERLLDRHPLLAQSVSASDAFYRKFRLIPRSTWAFFHYAFGRVDNTARDRWCALVCGDEPAANDSGPGLLRNRLVNATTRRSSGVGRAELLAIGIKSWRMLCQNRTGQKLYWLATGDRVERFPAVDPRAEVDTPSITGAPEA